MGGSKHSAEVGHIKAEKHRHSCLAFLRTDVSAFTYCRGQCVFTLINLKAFKTGTEITFTLSPYADCSQSSLVLAFDFFVM